MEAIAVPYRSFDRDAILQASTAETGGPSRFGTEGGMVLARFFGEAHRFLGGAGRTGSSARRPALEAARFFHQVPRRERARSRGSPPPAAMIACLETKLDYNADDSIRGRGAGPKDTPMKTRVTEALARFVTVVLVLGWSLPSLAAGAEGIESGSASLGHVLPSTASQRAEQGQQVSAQRTARRYSAPRSRARRARVVKAVAAQREREARELATPRFKLDADGTLVPDVRAAAAVIYNPSTHEVLWQENGDDARSIASITKVMTAIVFLEHPVDVDGEVEVTAADVWGANHTYLRGRERVRVDDLLNLLLVASDNAAARALARISPFGSEGFVDQMNLKAAELELTHTRYADPSGLDPGNVSSAIDMARLIAYASADERIALRMRKTGHQITTNRRSVTLHNTNRLVGSGIDVRGGKTGFIRSAGYCLATLLTLPQTDQQVAVVVLGARSNAGRFMETRHLFDWIASKAQQVFGGDPYPEHDQ
jgi:D-alanyl-D-alanine endopeptidase (penicillin-binding protein 7)